MTVMPYITISQYLLSAGISDAVLIKNIKNENIWWESEPVVGDLTANTSYSELSVCVRFKFTSFLPDRY